MSSADEEMVVEAEAAAAEADNDEVMAAVVVDDDDDEEGGGGGYGNYDNYGDDDDGDREEEDDDGAERAMVVEAAPVVVETPKKKSSSKSPKNKKSKTPKSSSKKSSSKGKNNNNAANTTSSSSTKKKKKKKSKSSTGGANNNNNKGPYSTISPERMDAAANARTMLVEAVPTLPMTVADIVVRSFGRLYLEPATTLSKFSSANALYPIGFSCDRFEFSPVHGRLLKMRCSILDGRKIKEQQVQYGVVPVSDWIPDGPVFRIMWGQGIDEDVDEVDYPYDPYTMSSPLTADQVDAVAIPTLSEGSGKALVPRHGMRVKASLEKDEIQYGTITKVETKETESSGGSKKKKRKQYEVEIQYDEGSVENILFPDSDISLLLPEAESLLDSEGHVDHRYLNGKPVHTVLGTSPLEAWGKVLTKLGLTDEIISDSAHTAVTTAREQGLQEALGKVEGKGKGGGHHHSKAAAATKKSENGETQHEQQPAGETSEGGGEATKIGDDGESGGVEAAPQDGSEPPSEEEEALRTKVDELRKELDSIKAEDRSATVTLAEKRINALGSYLCNPFPDTDPKQPQQSSWLATTIRKEKTKMGSTGNKKKIVTATDLLERNDTFYNPDIESLIEGLPGSEYCASYVFQAFRSGGAAATSRAWVHEAQVRAEKEREKKLKASKEKKAIASHKKEKDLKRKKQEDIRDERKRQKVEEEEEKKKARIEERLARLQVQVDDRLLKDASSQREKAIVAFAKTFTKEYNKRRRAAELVAGQSIVETKRRGHAARTTHVPLPPLSKIYDEDVLQVWDFVSTFGSFFVERGYFKVVPTIESLQSAVNSLRGGSAMSKEHAISSLTNLAMALCKPLAVSQTRLLFASLIALYPTLQKDFGAAFFNDMDENVDKESGEGSSATNTDVLLPVNSMTWQDIARIAFLSDALGELGYTRHDSAHLLRGYRSAGHPNSKESRRLRRVEDYSIALLRQELSDGRQESKKRPPNVVRLEIPNTPSCFPSDWMFHLMNVRSISPNAGAGAIKKHVKKALSLLKSSSTASDHKETIASLDHCMDLLAKTDSPQAKAGGENSSSKKAKQIVVDLLDKLASRKQPKEGISNMQDVQPSAAAEQRTDATGPKRKHMGLVANSLTLTKEEYKELVHIREEYMSDALKLKEEMERQARKKKKEERGADDEDDEEDDDDDEEDDDEDDEEDIKVNEAPKSDDTPGDAKESSDNDKTEDQASKKTNDEVAKGEGEGDSAVKGEAGRDAMENDKAEKELSSVDGKASAVKSESEAVAMEVENSSDVSNGNKSKIASESNKVEASDYKSATVDPNAPKKIGKETEYDEFCEDIPTAPTLIRRCLAVLRSLALAGPSEPFIYPVDPQTNPGYYDMVLRPSCLWKAGKELQAIGLRLSKPSGESLNESEKEEVEAAVVQFGRNIRLISHNCLSYANAGPMVIAAGGEFLRIFERLFLDWVLAPPNCITPLSELDDDRCVEHHPSDEQSTVLLCDGCEGNFNISRLDPPLTVVPKGDWYCPRCVSGRWYGHLDPRVGETVSKDVDSSDVMSDKNSDDSRDSQLVEGQIEKCVLLYPEGDDSKPKLMYEVKMDDGKVEIWTLDQVDEALRAAGETPPPVRCIQAIAESQGYGCFSPQKTVMRDLVPVPLNPNISDAAAQAALSSSVFRDTIYASGTLLVINPEEMRASEWLRLLVLLAMKCASSDVLQNLASKLENEAAEGMSKNLGTQRKVSDVADVLEEVADGDEAEEDEEEEEDEDAEMMDITEEKKTDGVQEMTNTSEQKEAQDAAVKAGDGVKTEQRPPSKSPSALEQSGKKSPMMGAKSEQSGKKSPMMGAKSEVAKPPTAGEQESPRAMEVEPSAVEDVNGANPDPITSEGDPTAAPSEPVEIVVVDPAKERRTAALSAKTKREKAREESISAFSMKSQLRPTVASFEEDGISDVIDSALASKLPGLSFASTRCRKSVCDFCGLTDTALGAPLVRVPDDAEWDDYIPHCSRSRRVQIIADMQGKSIHDDTTNASGESESNNPSSGKLVAVTIRIGDELVSKPQNPKFFDRTEDGGMLEFCPRNTEGFQNELSFRSEKRLPFVTGSLSAHTCCAIAAHNARKVYVVQQYKERTLELAEADAGMTCGRTLSIGKDNTGRFYWKFHRDMNSLFVFVPKDGEGASSSGEWHRFSKPACIASVIMSLGKDSIVKDLKRTFPVSSQMLMDGTWRGELLKHHFPNALNPPKENDAESSDQESTADANQVNGNAVEEEEEEPFEVGEDVLVESKSGKLLWDASVVELSQARKNGPVDGYKVRYKGWSERFDEWVVPTRLVEPSENNRQVQEEMLEEAASQRDGLPPALVNMVAKEFLRVKDRARGNIPLPNFASIAHVHARASTDDRTFAMMKAAILLIEAALPMGAVDNTSQGPWKPEVAQQWRLMVERSEDTADLMRLTICLEDTIDEEWYKTDVGHLRSCLPNRWKALGESSAAALAVRVILLDRGVSFEKVDRKRYVEKAPASKKK